MLSRDPAHLHPAMREFWEALVPLVKAELSLTVFLTCTWRDHAEQARLYAQGRTGPGSVVTNARPGQSAHNVAPPEGSHALDFAVREGATGVTWAVAPEEHRAVRAPAARDAAVHVDIADGARRELHADDAEQDEAVLPRAVGGEPHEPGPLGW